SRIKLLSKRGCEAVGEHLHGVAQPLAEDANAVQVFVIVQVSRDGLFKLLKQGRKQRPGEVEQQVQVGLLRLVDRRHGLGKEAIEREWIVLAGNLQQLLGRLAPRNGVAY